MRPGDAEDLALAQVEVDALDDFAARILRVGGAQALDLEDDFAGLSVALGEALLHLPADHEADDLLERRAPWWAAW